MPRAIDTSASHHQSPKGDAETRDGWPRSVGEQTTVAVGRDRTATVEVSRDRDYRARVDVVLDRRWTFGVRDDGVAELLGTFEDGRQVGTSVPDWMEWALRQIGLEGLDA